MISIVLPAVLMGSNGRKTETVVEKNTKEKIQSKTVMRSSTFAQGHSHASVTPCCLFHIIFLRTKLLS